MCIRDRLPPESRENKIKQGFAALRTSYEAQVVFGLFNGVVQRFNERVSVDSLRNVSFTDEIRNEFLECFSQCCRYMEGHLHSDKYANQKPTLENLNAEIKRFDSIAKSIKSVKRNKWVWCAIRNPELTIKPSRVRIAYLFRIVNWHTVASYWLMQDSAQIGLPSFSQPNI